MQDSACSKIKKLFRISLFKGGIMTTFRQTCVATALDAGCYSLAALCYRHPIGAAGGALFGVVHALSANTINGVVEHAFGQIETIAQLVCKYAVQFFGGFAATWAALAVAGFTLTFVDVVALNGIAMALEYLFVSVGVFVAFSLGVIPEQVEEWMGEQIT